MFDAPAACLAIAQLMEAGDGVSGYRHRPDRPLQGYCLVTGDERDYRVTIYVENARTLAGRSPGESFYYEGWLLAEDGPVSIGAFNTGAAGEGSGTCIREAQVLGLERAGQIRVTAEPFGGTDTGHTPVLEGALIWLYGRPEPAAEAVEAEVPVPVPVPALRGEAAVPGSWSGLLSGAGEPVSALPQPEPEREPQPEPESREPSPAMEPPPQPEAAGKEPPPEEGPAVHPFKLVPEPATLVSQFTPLSLNIQLETRHPMVPRAVGAAVLHLRDGRMTLTVRNLPSPAALGRAPGRDRPWNAYRVWLMNEHTGQREPLGLLAKVWGENYRYQSENGLPLSKFDAVLVTAEDRSAAAPSNMAPQVVLGGYQPV